MTEHDIYGEFNKYSFVRIDIELLMKRFIADSPYTNINGVPHFFDFLVSPVRDEILQLLSEEYKQ